MADAKAVTGSHILPDVLPDVLAPGLRVVFCGTGAGTKSAELRAYYAGPGNRFWPMLAKTGLTPHRIAPSDYRAILSHGLGLTDIAKAHVGSDAVLDRTHVDAEGLRDRISAVAPRFLAFTSKRAAGLYLRRPTGRIDYGLQAERIGETILFVLPSPSGAARGVWTPVPWHELAELAGRAG